MQQVTTRDVCQLTPAQVSEHWGNIEWRLREIPNFDEDWTIEAVCEAIADGSWAVWTVGKDLVVITAIADFPKTKVMTILFAHGTELEPYFELLFSIFKRYAALKECSRIELFAARSGWERKLRRLPGVSARYTIYSCDVPAMEKGH